MAKYTIKPIEVEAVQYNNSFGEYPYSETLPNWLRDMFINGKAFIDDSDGQDILFILSPLGQHEVYNGNYLVKFADGSVFPFDSMKFEEMYEFVSLTDEHNYLTMDSEQLELPFE